MITARWWDDVVDLRTAIHGCEFVRSLGEGTLDRRVFSYYIAQDVLYLREFARLLNRAAEKSSTSEEAAFWRASADECVGVELSMHRKELERWGSNVELSAVNRAYIEHLAASDTSHSELVAALLPCFWIYDDVGATLRSKNHANHAYEQWLNMYGSDEFAEATSRARAYVESSIRNLRSPELARAWEAFRVSCEHELAFFGMWHGETAVQKPTHDSV